MPDGDYTSIYLADPDGSNEEKLNTVNNAYAPLFSSDGTKVYFWGAEDSSSASLFSVNTNGTNETSIATLPYPDSESKTLLRASPDKSKFLYTASDGVNYQLYTINNDGSNIVQAYEGVIDENTNAILTGVSWSPDSTKLVFSVSEDGQKDIYTVNADGTGLTNLTNTPEVDETIVFTDDAWGAAPESGSSDSDNDGISDTVENNGPNGGDANNDGIQDSEQAYVSSFVDSITGEYAVLAVSDECTISSVSVSAESANSTQDQDFSYPAGLMDFTLDCGTPGFSADISQYYYGQDSSDFLIRKYNPSSKTYTTIDGAEIADLTIASKKVVKASYIVKDGGSLDLDNTTDGNISDPSGLASQTATLADTGQNTNPLILISSLLLTSGLTLASFSFYKQWRGTKCN